MPRTTFDIVLMDVRMPGLSGLATFRLIKTFCKATGVILMSAYSVVDLKREALREGAVAVMQKPLDIESVLALVRNNKRPPLLLFIDDEKQRELLSNCLEDHRYRTCAVGTSAEAVQLAGQIRFNTVVFDRVSVRKQSTLLDAMCKVSRTPMCVTLI